ncbi:class I SAM-dependent methyltransferase [Mariprofundus erugo]|uniref:class I SAM-dependent methyltransferase n=1 Tax=Mariprofundus erugo TaxID=2528639 RepID=UPI0010FDD8C1|nr:class I SAM-dependent methyltransferase [Mariprofundus erugo]TLS76043.1 class I SAM-dependent methyltransferase [Mariprofundus erugo]
MGVSHNITMGPEYIRTPLNEIDGIPVFSEIDRYIENYQRISSDHLAAMESGGDNPFIETDLWIRLEKSTSALIEKYAADGDRVLDVGVGLGRVLKPFNHLRRYGIDISFDYLKKARENGFEVAFSKIEDMPYEDGFFDVVVACDVLEHVIDLHACCVQIIRVLKPGGTLIVRVPYMDDMNAYLDESLPYELIHLRSFDVATLRILFEKINALKYVEHDFVEPYPKDGLFKIRLLSKESTAAKVAKKAWYPWHPLWILRQATKISHEEYRQWFYNLRDTNPEILRELLPDLADALEVNVVFVK